MFQKISNTIFNWVNNSFPWTNVYGLARTIIALSTALTLALNNATTLFKPGVGMPEYPICNNSFSIFCIVPNTYFWLNIVRWLCVVILLLIASGWRPRITAIFHWWISYSLQLSALTLDGGEQAASVLTLLILPIALTDPRRSHWEKSSRYKRESSFYTKTIALVSFNIIRIQVAIIYFSSTISKLHDDEWINGTAVYYYLQEPMLGLNPILMKLAQPVLSSWLIVLPTWGTLIIQTILFASLLAPKKYWKYILICALLMHEVFAIMLGLISFSMVMCAALILYLRPKEQEYRFSFLRRKVNNIAPLKEVK